MKLIKYLIFSLFVIPFLTGALFSQANSGSPSKTITRIITDEADAVMMILDKSTNGLQIEESDWQKLFSTEGYVRLKEREHSMGRKFEDSTFRSFVLSRELQGRFAILKGALEEWKKMDVEKAALQSLKYLPEGTIIKAKIYPVIKPLSNSFVFGPDTDPAIFMYINPAIKPEKLFNTLSHELHHIGIQNACGKTSMDTTLPKGVLDALEWITAFSEGRAMLASAGGFNVHPHAVSDSTDRAVWDRDYANRARDMKDLEDFFLKLIDGKIPEKDKVKEGMKFINRDDIPQGAFYTVGWLMASTVEKVFGKERLIASSCDGYMFMWDYNRAAKELNANGENLPLWGERLLSELKGR